MLQYPIKKYHIKDLSSNGNSPLSCELVLFMHVSRGYIGPEPTGAELRLLTSCFLWRIRRVSGISSELIQGVFSFTVTVKAIIFAAV